MEALSICMITIFVVVIIVAFLCYIRNGSQLADLSRKCVLVTGCDTGFGHQLALQLDLKGLRVFAGCLTEEGEKNLQQISSQRLSTLRLDVTKHQDIESALEVVTEEITGNNTVLWAVVNNAGIAASGLIDWSSLESMQKVFDVNLWGMVDMCKTFLPLLKQSHGRIINVASSAGKVAMPGAFAYSASKFAVQSFCDALRNEVRAFGVSVHTIDPGFFKTNLTDSTILKQIAQRQWNRLDQHLKEEYGKEFYENAVDLLKLMDMISSKNTNVVVNAMSHAVTSTRPRLRYILGWDHKLVWRWFAMMPSEVQDFVFSLTYPIPASCKKS